jgi:hypothetical protein
MFGGTTPENISQDLETGANDLTAAKATIMSYPY